MFVFRGAVTRTNEQVVWCHPGFVRQSFRVHSVHDDDDGRQWAHLHQIITPSSLPL
jgi:hypothetical protein